MMNAEAMHVENTLLKETIQKQELMIAELQQQVQVLRVLHYGPKSEKLTTEDKKQGRLFNEAEDTAFDQHDEEQQKTVRQTVEVASYTKRIKSKAGRKPISKDLPREIIEYDIPDEDKVCACGTKKICIGADVCERAKIIPAKVVVLQERRKKYSCKSCEGTTLDEKGIQTAEGVRHLVAGSIADESLLAWSIHEKFEYALPFYRQSKRLTHIGIPIPRATLSNLAIKSAQACKPIYELLKKTIQEGPIINADETRVQVLKEPGRAAQAQSWMWVFVGGGIGKESVLFHYDPGRSHTVPYEFLGDYSGWLQTDDFEAYHTALKRIQAERETGEGIRHVLCWAHVRRRFYKYWEISKSEEAHTVLKLVQKLFRLEELRSKDSLEEFSEERKRRAGPHLDQLQTLLMQLALRVPPGLALGKAIHYTLDNWEQLILYLENPLVTPSNNRAENAIRPFVIGRKNWMFSGTPKGAESSAILYSLVETVKIHKLSVYDYFYYILKKIPYCSTPEDYAPLLPYNLDSESIVS